MAEAEKLFEKYFETHDILDRNKIIEKFLYIAEIFAKKYSQRGVEYDDLYQVAVLALIKAVDRFDLSKNLKFVTFASPSVEGEIKNYFRDKSRIIKFPRKQIALMSEIRKIQAESEKRNEPLTAKQIAIRLNVLEEDVIECLEFNGSVISLDSKVPNIDADLYEIIPEKTDSFEEFENKEFVQKIMQNLSEKEKEFVTLRYLKQMSQTQIAEVFNVSQMFISRLEKKVLEKLRSAV